MQQIVTTGRLISRALWNGFTNLAPSNSEHVNKKREPSFLYAVCGFPKETSRKHPPIKGKFGDDAWFSAKGKAIDVLGICCINTLRVIHKHNSYNNNNIIIIIIYNLFMYKS